MPVTIAGTGILLEKNTDKNVFMASPKSYTTFLGNNILTILLPAAHL